MRTSNILRAGLVAALTTTPALLAQGPALETADDPSLGPRDAPVTVVMFCDFQCPHCGRSHHAARALADRHPEVRLVYRDFPIVRSHPLAALAAEAAACAQDQGRYWEMWERLFANQSSLDEPSLRRHARTIGLNGTAFDECLASGRHRAGWQADRRDGEALGVSGTPTFFINGQRVEGELTLEELERQIVR